MQRAQQFCRGFLVPQARAMTAIGDLIMKLTHPERRELARLPLQLLLRVRVSGSKQVEIATTRDVSARGIYFHTHAQLQLGQDLECVLVLPEKLTQAATPILVACWAKVLRLNKSLVDKSIGVAVEVYGYDFSWQESQVPARPETQFGS
jgi:hypothetical protein